MSHPTTVPEKKSVRYHDIKVIQEYSNADRTAVTVWGILGEEVVVCELSFSKDNLYGNHIKRFEDCNKTIFFMGKNNKMNMEEAEEVFDESVRVLKEYGT